MVAILEFQKVGTMLVLLEKRYFSVGSGAGTRTCSNKVLSLAIA